MLFNKSIWLFVFISICYLGAIKHLMVFEILLNKNTYFKKMFELLTSFGFAVHGEMLLVTIVSWIIILNY